MKRGFTLIELLAVIVILAIIALIAIPITVNIVDGARLSAKQRSAEFYVDAIDLAMIDYLHYNSQLDNGVYTLRQLNEILEIEVNESGISFTEDSYLYIENSKVKSYNFITEKGEDITFWESTNGSTSEDNLNVVSCNINNKCYSPSSSTPVYVYFDPVNGEECTSDSTSATCYKWIVIAYNTANWREATTVELISAKNLIESSAWIDSTDYGCEGAKCAKTDKGPLTALKNLKEFTKDWKIQSQNYVYRDIDGNNINPTIKNTYSEFSYMSKARILNRYEVNSLWGLTASLFEGEPLTEFFWSATTTDATVARVQMRNSATNYNGTAQLGYSTVTHTNNQITQEYAGLPIGIRPVITLPASILD